MPDLASTLSTQAEEANDENISFLLRAELTDEQDSTDFDGASDSGRRVWRAVNLLEDSRVYTVSQWPHLELARLHGLKNLLTLDPDLLASTVTRAWKPARALLLRKDITT